MLKVVNIVNSFMLSLGDNLFQIICLQVCIFSRSQGGTTLKGGDKVKAAESVERILKLAEGKMVCAEHKVTK